MATIDDLRRLEKSLKQFCGKDGENIRGPRIPIEIFSSLLTCCEQQLKEEGLELEKTDILNESSIHKNKFVRKIKKWKHEIKSGKDINKIYGTFSTHKDKLNNILHAMWHKGSNELNAGLSKDEDYIYFTQNSFDLKKAEESYENLKRNTGEAQENFQQSIKEHHFKTKIPPVIPTKFKPYFAHPKPVEEHWVGRKKELTELNQYYQTAKVVGIEAFGGFGKSALASKWLEELIHSDNPPDGVFWWCFYHEDSLNAFLEASLNYFSGDSFQPEEASTTYARVRKLWKCLSHGRFILVLDGLEGLQNAEDKGEHFGEMKEREFTDLLRGIAEGRHSSFVLITTRYLLKDLYPYEKRTFHCLHLDHLSPDDGLQLMRKLGVIGEDIALDKVAQDYDYHALSLRLISGYLRVFYKGDIAHAPEISFRDLETDKKVASILSAYGKKLDITENVFMSIFSIFSYQVEEKALTMVFRQPISDFDNQILIELPDFNFRQAINHLVNLGLVNKDETPKGIVYSTHPLIHGYYYEHMEDKARISLHRQVAQYYKAEAHPDPKTLDDLNYAIEAFYHTVKTKDYEQAYMIYRQRINIRGAGENYLVIHKLSAYELDLSLISQLFPAEDTSQEPLLASAADKAWLINEVGACLIYLGQLEEAISYHQRAIRIAGKNDWENALFASRLMCYIQIRLGNPAEGETAARQALGWSRRTENKNYECNSLSYGAYAAFLQGKNKEAQKLFEQANKLEREITPKAKWLCSNSGVWYAEFLARSGKKKLAEKITQENLRFCRDKNWQNSIARCHRLLARFYTEQQNYSQAEDHLNNGQQIARNSGLQEETAPLHLGFARLYLARNHLPQADSAIKETLAICASCGYKIIEIDARNILAQIYHAEGKKGEARIEAKKALEMSQSCSYHWGQIDAQKILSKLT